jgi:hypothetical protein
MAMLVAVSAAAVGACSQSTTSPPQQPTTLAVRPVGAATSPPVFAYFYQWFTATSWTRAKQDFPLAGRYSSDDPHVLRDQVQQARGAGIDGFLTSWKSTDALNRRLDMLVRVAHDERFSLGVVYEALDFQRKPLPVATIRRDLRYLVSRWGASLTSRYYGRPLIIWTGTDKYSLQDVQSVRDALGRSAYLLAAAKSVSGYQRVAKLVDGEAYYWSSADPTSSATTAKLVAMADAVHAHGGIWVAPAAPGFDGRTLNHTRVIDRRDGLTLVQSLEDAVASKPDILGVISWNEWSENTYIEPGERYGSRELDVLRRFLNGGEPAPQPDRSQATLLTWSGLQAVVVLGAVTALGSVLLGWRIRRRPAADPAADPASGLAADTASGRGVPHF